MPHINDLFPSAWLKASDFDEGPQDLTIREVTVETLGHGAKREEKNVIYFEETKKGLVVNKTNAGTIAGAYGPRTENWPGQVVQLFSTKVPFGSDIKDGIRIRIPKAADASELVSPEETAAKAQAPTVDPDLNDTLDGDDLPFGLK